MKILHISISLLLFSTIVFLSLGINQPAYACQCTAQRPSPNEVFEKSTAVFSGEVIAINKDDSSHTKTVKFDVQRIWKGVSGNQTTVITGSDDGNCGYPFVMNETYVVYAAGNPLYTQSCGRNALFTDSYDDLKVLGTGIEVPEFPFVSIMLVFGIVSVVVIYRIRK